MASTEPKYGVLATGFECPVVQMCMAPLWSLLPCVIERMMQQRSVSVARRGMSSPTWMPGERVAIGL